MLQKSTRLSPFVILIAGCFSFTSATSVLADNPTPTVAPTTAPTAEPTSRPAPTATPTVVPTSAPHPTGAPAVQPENRVHRQTKNHASATPVANSTAKHKRHQKHHKAKPKPTATPTATQPPLSLSTEDSVKPVTCNGKSKAVAPLPFLSPPFKGWTSIVSYFDHDSPDFSRDGTVITATGLEAQPNPHHQATDFPAYWNESIRQYIYYDGHNGYDFNLSYQPVYAAAAGKVIFARFEYLDAPDHGYGKMVMISHPGGYVTLYGHFDQIRVKKGQRVKRGQLLGISGNTGHSTGPHLHFTVFHNCTPTDPYGWTGSGQDPLAGYQNETSKYLWTRPPLVFNPLPGMPGTARLPKTPISRILLLRLPSTTRGTFAFVKNLKAEMNRVRRQLGNRGVKPNPLLGGLTITADTSASRLYRLPDVASIAAPYVASDDQSDLLAALARAALVTPRQSLHFGGGQGWSGYLFTWQGRTLLLGKGPKDQQVTLRLTSSNRRSTTRKLLTDPSTGAYAIDLGGLTSSQRAALKRQLQGESARSSLTFQPVRNSASPFEKPKTGGFDYRAILVSLLVVTVVAGVVLFRRFPSPNRPA